jgi:MOSC domain-containing protein YiiM
MGDGCVLKATGGPSGALRTPYAGRFPSGKVVRFAAQSSLAKPEVDGHQGDMNMHSSPALLGHVASLHLHPAEPGTPLHEVDAIEVVAAKGIAGDSRYFGRLSRDTGQPTRRQVSLIEREQIAEHATALGLQAIPPGAVRSNIETEGVKLISHLGRQIQIGEAVLFLHTSRDPCARMDAICQGLRALMLNNRQGVMAEVVRSGKIRRGDAILLPQEAC